MTVYRISACRFINDLSGRGAALYGGRWNSKDTYILYTAQSRALALLETVVHIGRMPVANYCLAEIEVPDEGITIVSPRELPENWAGNPAPDYLKAIGDNFITKGKHLLLKIPSALMMEEYNYLLNPAHPDFKKVKVRTERSITIDERLQPVA